MMTDTAAVDPAEVISHRLIEEGAVRLLASVEDYWTEERLLEAQPIGIEAQPAPAVLAMFAREWEPEGDETSKASVLPEGGGSAGAVAGAVSGPDGFETRRVATPGVFPYCAVGKLFMTFGGKNFVGSAWVAGESALFTAGHCIYDERMKKPWAERVLFIPQYHQGQEPLGRWAATSLHTLSGWAAGGADRYQFDMAVARLDRPVRPDTGAIGWMANFPPDQGPYEAIGYPLERLSKEYPFDGREMWRCVGDYISGTNPVKMANNMTQGCSGGPWVIERDGGIYANGLSSYRWSTEPLTMNSPYFGRAFLNLVAYT